MKNLPILILAGGLGKRISKYYGNTQKCMIKFNDKPFLQYVIENFVRNNFKNIIILAGYNSHQIFDYFGYGKSLILKLFIQLMESVCLNRCCQKR